MCRRGPGWVCVPLVCLWGQSSMCSGFPEARPRVWLALLALNLLRLCRRSCCFLLRAGRPAAQPRVAFSHKKARPPFCPLPCGVRFPEGSNIHRETILTERQDRCVIITTVQPSVVTLGWQQITGKLPENKRPGEELQLLNSRRGRSGSPGRETSRKGSLRKASTTEGGCDPGLWQDQPSRPGILGGASQGPARKTLESEAGPEK